MLKKLLAVVAVAFLLGACEEAPPPTPTPPPARNFLVFFDFDKSTLTPRAMDIVKEAASVAKAGQNARVTCTGHTDTAGPANYNMALSLRRANAVKNELVRQGVRADAIVVKSEVGSPLPKAGDGLSDPSDRRVTIKL